MTEREKKKKKARERGKWSGMTLDRDRGICDEVRKKKKGKKVIKGRQRGRKKIGGGK